MLTQANVTMDVWKPPRYLIITDKATNNKLGVLRCEYISGRNTEHFEISGSCILKPLPSDGAEVYIRVADEGEYSVWRSKVAASKKRRFWAAVVLTITAGAFQLAFDIGKVHTVFHVCDTIEIIWTVAKYLMLGIGVYAIQQYAAFKSM